MVALFVYMTIKPCVFKNITFDIYFSLNSDLVTLSTRNVIFSLGPISIPTFVPSRKHQPIEFDLYRGGGAVG